MDTDSIDSSTEKALIEGYTAISGQPLQEGLLSWLFGKNTTVKSFCTIMHNA